MTESVQEPEAHALAESRALNDISKPQNLGRRLEDPENVGCMHDRSNEIGLGGLGHGAPALYGASRSTVNNRFGLSASLVVNRRSAVQDE
jgi:hypothetical protein